MSDLGKWLASDILTLGMAADDARRVTASSSIVTYLRVHTMTAATLGSGEGVPEAAWEVRVYEAPASFDEAVAQVWKLKERAGDRRVVAYSMADLEARAAGEWPTLAAMLRSLVEAGLMDVAELPVDRLQDPSASVRALRTAGANPRRLTISQPVGDRTLEILESVKRCFAASGPMSFAPLPRQAPVDKPTTGYEDLRMIALARLALGETMDNLVGPHIEVDWGLYGPKLAQVALTFGADHLDAVPATSDPSLGPRRATIQDVERNIRSAGFEPLEYRPTA